MISSTEIASSRELITLNQWSSLRFPVTLHQSSTGKPSFGNWHSTLFWRFTPGMSFSFKWPCIIISYNASVSSRCMCPPCIKIAEVEPTPKDGDRDLASNNLPMSLLPVLSKICERVVHNQIQFLPNLYGTAIKEPKWRQVKALNRNNVN